MPITPRQRRGQLSLLLVAGIAGVAVGFGLLYGAYRIGKKAGEERTPQSTISIEVIVEQIKQVSQLVAAKAYMETIVDYNDNKRILLGLLNGRKHILVRARGHLNLGVDLNRLAQTIDTAKKTVTVTVPHAAMLDRPVLDTSFVYYDIHTARLNPFSEHDVSIIQCSVDSAFRAAGHRAQLVQQADSNVKQALVSLIQGYGYKPIITFLPAPPDSSAAIATARPVVTPAAGRRSAPDAQPTRCAFDPVSPE